LIRRLGLLQTNKHDSHARIHPFVPTLYSSA
jgi:hypothetical protein